jgi:hypothetical protein
MFVHFSILGRPLHDRAGPTPTHPLSCINVAHASKAAMLQLESVTVIEVWLLLQRVADLLLIQHT